MVALISRLKSLANFHTTRQQQDSPSPTTPQLPQAPSSRTTGRHSISPKLRTFFEPHSPKTPLGAIESPTSPESAYSGVAVLGDVEIVRRVSRGKVKRIELSKVSTYESVSVGTQTESAKEGKAAAELVRKVLRRRSGVDREAWEMLHSGVAGLLFLASPVGEVEGEGEESLGKTALPLTGNLLRKLQEAIALDAALQACQKRTARELASLNAQQEHLRKRKETLKERLEQLKLSPGSELDEEKLGVDRELVRVWEASIDAMDERLRVEERLEGMRERFERGVRAALAVLALGLVERGVVDVVDGGSEGEGERWRRRASEWGCEGRWRGGW